MASKSYGSLSPRVPVGVQVAADNTEHGIFAKVIPPYAEVTQFFADLKMISEPLGAASSSKMGQYSLRVIYGNLPVDDAIHTMTIEQIVATYFPIAGGQVFEGDVATGVEASAGLYGQTDITPVAYSKSYTLYSKLETLGLPSHAVLVGDANIAFADRTKIRSYPNKRKRGFRKPRREGFKFLAVMANSETIPSTTNVREMMFGDTTGDFETLVTAWEAALITEEAGTGDQGLTNDAEDYLSTGLVAVALSSEAALNFEGDISFTCEYYKRNPSGRKHWRPV